MGFRCPPYNQNKEIPPRILATGGASANHSLLQVLSDVFNSPVYVQSRPNSAAIGSCLIAKYGIIDLKKIRKSFKLIYSNLYIFFFKF